MRNRFVLGIALALVASSMTLGPVSASTSTGTTQQSTCTEGDLAALGQELPVAYAMYQNGQDHPGLLEAYLDCQYRVFFDGATYTYCEGQTILGGIVELDFYKAEGISRKEAIGFIELAGDRVWIDGVEQTLHESAYKDYNRPGVGITVFQNRSFTIALPAGDHVSTYVGTYPGYPDFTATITLHILPRALCA
jgi:hypothetical protein